MHNGSMLAPTGRWVAVCLVALFAVSGLSGLIYESIWAHYLKLLLGHAAYAQTVVLVIFMGGMALGAWYAARRTACWRNLLLGYALVEGAIGLAGIFFHDIFAGASVLAHSTIMPALGGAAAVITFKWGLAALMVLPQSVLLGMTFPLMSGAYLRRFPAAQGRSLAMLYFANSLGASVGVLAGGFVLMPLVGLPGTVLTAGVLNVALALAVWLLARSGEPFTAPTIGSRLLSPSATESARLMLAIAFATGMASFVYEVTWVRMLSLVLGSSTHAFELMLSAFILGLALGSLWIRTRIDNAVEPLAVLAGVQLAMGTLALATLFLYDWSFDAMAWFMAGVQRNDHGYVLFNLASHFTAFAVMLPVTVCAGMTLPLITYVLLQRGHGERSIGLVYAANTFGAIVGVIVTVHLGFPWLGLHGSMGLGAAIDLTLGAVLVAFVLKSAGRPMAAALGIAALALVVLGLVMQTVEFDPRKLVSGVYRYGDLNLLGQGRVTYHEDGKTATVNVIDYPVGSVSILTNGKTDATVTMRPGRGVSGDEYTMTLAAVLPLLANPGAKRAAVIGFGAGMSTHVLLGSATLEQVDTVEIEPRMVAAARAFLPRVERAYNDPRSRIFYDDARSFFSTQQQRYDLVMSEPSNPWVSGIAALYTREFYLQVRQHLSNGGVFAQWLHGSELSTRLFASVATALGQVFDDYAVFDLNGHDLLVVARAGARLSMDLEWPFAIASLRTELATIDVLGPADLEVRYLGSKALLQPWLVGYGVPANSDYFPVLDLGAAKMSFLGANTEEMFALRRQPVPLHALTRAPWVPATGAQVTPAIMLEQSRVVFAAQAFVDALGVAENFSSWAGDGRIPMAFRERLSATKRVLVSCGRAGNEPDWWSTTEWLAHQVMPHLDAQRGARLLQALVRPGCAATWSRAQQRWIDLLWALVIRDQNELPERAVAYLQADPSASSLRRRLAVAAAMFGLLQQGQPSLALQMLANYGRELDPGASVALQVMAALASSRINGKR